MVSLSLACVGEARPLGPPSGRGPLAAEQDGGAKQELHERLMVECERGA